MEFDSLAFSAARSAPAHEDNVYCPDCQEYCRPDKHSVRPACPTCGGATMSRPPLQLRREPLVGEETSTSTGNDSRGAAAHTRPRPASEMSSDPEATPAPPDIDGAERSPAPPPSTTNTNTAVIEQRNRGAVSERVAEEVLAFMAAIERGDLSTAVGLPAPPGAALLEDLPGIGAGFEGPRRPRSAPALERVIKGLPRVKVDENSWVLHQTVVRVKGVATELTIDAVFAPFSPPPTEPVIGHVVLAVPPAADKKFENEGDIKGSVLVIDRGVCTFASKALRAEAAGAAAAVIVQTQDVWPYVMEDSKGEAKAGGGLNIPVCMVRKEKGETIKKAIKDAAGSETVRAEVSVSSSEKDCIVCQEPYAVGATLIRLPCNHLYHEVCLLKWLKISNTCPYCRMELPSSNEEVERERRERDAAGAEGQQAWRSLFN